MPGCGLRSPTHLPDGVLERVLRRRADGARLINIAEDMNHDGVPTPGGGAR
jgi:hypothetical protein